MNIIIEQGRVVCPVQNLDCIQDIVIQDGKITTQPSESFQPDLVINGKDLLVLPGLVDPYGYHKDNQGNVYETVVEHAPKYGFTTLVCSPQNLTTDSPSRARKISEAANKVDIHPIGALTESLAGKQIADLTALKEAGCVAFSQDLYPIADLSMIRNCYLYAASFGLNVIIFPQEPSLANGYIHEGKISAMTGLKGIPDTAETIAVASQLQLIEETGVKAHFTHITCQKSLRLIERAQAQGLPVTAGCTMHHLHLSEMDVADLSPNAYVMPPLRSTTDLAGLRQGLEAGILTTIASSHQPLPRLSKLAPFAESTPGISSLATMLSLGLHLVKEGHLSLKTWVRAVTSGPLQSLGMQPRPLKAGCYADLCVVDPNQYWSVSEASLAPQATNTPFLGWELPGTVKWTIKNGEVIYQA